MTPEIIPSRLAQVTTLSRGSHAPNDYGDMCAMEAVAYIAGEPWSDHPECVCPVLAAFARSWNDGLRVAERDALLLPLIPRFVGTRGGRALAEKRALIAVDWLVRVHTPAWLRLAGLSISAAKLEALPEITELDQIPSIRGPIGAARREAATFAGVSDRCGGPSLWGAPDDWAVDWTAVGDAVDAATLADVWAFVWDEAWKSICDAVRWAHVGAWEAPKPPRETLMLPARDLLVRMIEAEC